MTLCASAQGKRRKKEKEEEEKKKKKGGKKNEKKKELKRVLVLFCFICLVVFRHFDWKI